MFASEVYAQERIINDATYAANTLPPVNCGRGLDLSARPLAGRAYEGVADEFPAALLIPRSEWQARIQELEEKKQRTSDLIKFAGLKSKDQKATNYCWINAPVHCVEIVRVKTGLEPIELSAGWAGGKIKEFRNDGGWGKEGLEFLVANGTVPASIHPNAKISNRTDTEENRQLALNYRVTEWWELKPRDLDEMVSLLLRGFPGAGGFNWWSHEVTLCDAVWLDGTVAIRIRNQWYPDGVTPWGDDNFGILQGQRMLPDDLVAPRVAVAM